MFVGHRIITSRDLLECHIVRVIDYRGISQDSGHLIFQQPHVRERTRTNWDSKQPARSRDSDRLMFKQVDQAKIHSRKRSAKRSPHMCLFVVLLALE